MEPIGSADPSIAHRHDMNHFGTTKYKDGLVPWRDALPPDIAAGRTTGSLRSCSYCGSMHPADLAEAIRAGAKGHWADFKYGWPHKAYIDGVPNPHVGLLESRMSMSHPPQAEIDAGKWIQIPDGFDCNTGKPQFRWTESGKPADATTYEKFYTVHLQDAEPEDKETIERHLGQAFEFPNDGRGVRWKPARIS